MKKIIKQLLYPNKFLGFLIFNISVFLLIYVFLYNKENTVIAYISYPLSAYALTYFCVWFYHICRNTYKKVKKSKIYKLYYSNKDDVTKIKLTSSLFFNLLYGTLKLLAGIYYESAWFITFAVYYLLLCFMKTSIVLSVKKEEFGKNLELENKKLKIIAYVLLFLDMVLSGIIVLIIKQNHIINYEGILIYVVAMYDFYLIITAIINIIKYRNNHSPLLIASKCINLTVAMISIVSLEVAMIYQFGNDDSSFKLIMTSCTGFGVAAINFIMSVYMIKKANKYLKK